jgi:hypothetical protein
VLSKYNAGLDGKNDAKRCKEAITAEMQWLAA